MDLSKKVSSLMTSDLTAVKPETELEKLKALFTRRSIHHIPVENKEGILLGLVSSEDLKQHSGFISSTMGTTAGHIMTTELYYLNLESSLKEALDLFLENRFRALPIVEKSGKLVGIITPYDFLRLIDKKSES